MFDGAAERWPFLLLAKRWPIIPLKWIDLIQTRIDEYKIAWMYDIEYSLVIPALLI